MSDIFHQFTGGIPENYDRYLGPMLFAPYAADLVDRCRPLEGRVLELACGTGIVTEQLIGALAQNCRLYATDLNEAMLTHAKGKTGAPENVEFHLADAQELHFDEDFFDLVVCQFGVTFFPDKDRAFAETRRVLKDSGRFLFNIWDSLDHNPLPRLVQEVLEDAIPDDPPAFTRMPFTYHRMDDVKALLEVNGFGELRFDVLPKVLRAESPEAAARGLVYGNPTINELAERHLDPEALVKRLAEGLMTAFGDPVAAPMQAIVVEARPLAQDLRR
jgi:SAM-dependent methyltransferase